MAATISMSSRPSAAQGNRATMESALSNIRHYQSLGLKNTGASLEEVKRAYKKLSLRYHPDRNSDPSATAKFQEISTAYNVLSTPRKRQVYDAYGEQGLKMYEQYVHMADTDDGGSKIPLQPVTMLLLLCVALSLVILLAAAFGVLLLLYLDGALASPLAVVLTPLWLIWACGLCCAYALLVSGRANRVYVARLALLLLCLTAFAVLLCVRADAGARLSYALVFLPLYLLEAADVAGAAARCRPAAYEAEKAVGRAQLPYFAHLVRVVGWAGAQLAVVVLLPLRLDGTIAAPWSALLAPVWVMLFYDAVARCTLSAAKGGGGGGKSESEREVAMRQYSMLQLVFTLAAAAMLGLLCLKLDGVLESWAFLFMPLFGAAAIYFCCCACCCCTLGLAPKPQARDVPDADYGPTPPSTERDPLLGAEEPTLPREGLAQAV